VTKYIPTGETMPIYDAAMKYVAAKTPLVIVAGKEYGTGSSRDWAAKGTNLLGVRAVIAESFERIHRSNLVGMGVLPLQFKEGTTRASLKLTGDEKFDIAGIAQGLKPRMDINVTITRKDGTTENVTVLCRIDTLDEIEYYKNGGILHYVLRSIAKAA
jgi:aconitate hydratase